MSELITETIKHGVTGYAGGCRCKPCRVAMNRKCKRDGTTPPPPQRPAMIDGEFKVPEITMVRPLGADEVLAASLVLADNATGPDDLRELLAALFPDERIAELASQRDRSRERAS
jgi:hypothetical protein